MIIQQTIDFIHQYHASDNSGHGTDHIMRVYRTALQLAEDYPNRVDLNVLSLAALLHDVDDHKLNPGGHVAQDFLSGKVDETTLTQVLATIAPISFSHSGAHPRFETIEQQLLSDADKLDAMGAIGICRTMAYGAAHHRPLYGEPGTDTLSHFYQKLLLLRDAMQTPAGRREAEVRHQAMLAFLENLYRETNIPRQS